MQTFLLLSWQVQSIETDIWKPIDKWITINNHFSTDTDCISSSMKPPCTLTSRLQKLLRHFEIEMVNAPINVNPVGGSAGKVRGFDAWDYPPVGLLIVQSDVGVGTFDFDRQKPGINSEVVTKSVPQGFLKVTLLEKGMKFSFVLITII